MTEPYYEALPTNLKPIHYDLSIFDINLNDDTFKGKVTIELDVVKPTGELWLNYRDLKISKVEIKDGQDGKEEVSNDIKVDSIEENRAKEYFIVKFATVAQGKLFASIEYDAILQSNMAGFFKSSYLEDGATKYMLATQFEATDARRAFPCLDEPALKATFKLDVTREGTVLGNMPVESVKGDTKYFEKTPIMSTYLLVWVCGEFEYIESFTENNYINGKPLPIRVYATKDHIKDAEFASEIAPKVVDLFSKIFEVKYPLPKLDLIEISRFPNNAMEGFGAITFRASALLYSESKSDPSFMKKVAYVISHEIGHQFFGDYVTMQWWSELWLNEGFATWIGVYALEYLKPEWENFTSFVFEFFGQALNLDGLRNSHPIEVPVVDALDIDSIFDAISYLKGASVISMLSKYIGEETFLRGVAKYLKEHQYSNATTHDLWNAIGDVSGKPVDQLMYSWIKKVGFPIVNVRTIVDDTTNKKSLVLSQSRFLNGGDATPEENETKWWIPLNADSDKPIVDSFDSETLVIDDFEGYIKLNKDTSGFYRVNYSDDLLENILSNFERLSASDLIGLIADSASIACAGDNSTDTFLKLVQDIVHKLNDDYVVWAELGSRLEDLSIAFGEGIPQIRDFIRSVYESKSVELIEELKQGVDTSNFLKTKLRSEILTKAGTLSVEPVYEYALELFNSEIQPSLRAFVYSTIASSKNFNNEQFEKILKEVTSPSTIDSREIALNALGCVSNVEFGNELFKMLLDPEIIPIMDSHFLGLNLSKNPVTKNAFLDFFLDNYDSFHKVMSTNMVVFDRFIKLTLKNFSSIDKFNKINDFFKTRDIHGFDRSLNQALDKIKINHNWFERDHKLVLEYFNK
ncbi:unnamed protein product [Candida verbasci]|uniref:Aminopeptidase n=1 Tax=Candida verbasci TaxID=1227364 RepID=A0A9W4TV66_9ASCO|nr:unnamed protein product [Candida verbasci]